LLEKLWQNGGTEGAPRGDGPSLKIQVLVDVWLHFRLPHAYGLHRPNFPSTRADRACGSIELATAESYGDLSRNPGVQRGHRSIGFPNRDRYLLVGIGTTVPAGVKKNISKFTNNRLI
jgi:hypothetical protein